MPLGRPEERSEGENVNIRPLGPEATAELERLRAQLRAEGVKHAGLACAWHRSEQGFGEVAIDYGHGMNSRAPGLGGVREFPERRVIAVDAARFPALAAALDMPTRGDDDAEAVSVSVETSSEGFYVVRACGVTAKGDADREAWVSALAPVGPAESVAPGYLAPPGDFSGWKACGGEHRRTYVGSMLPARIAELAALEVQRIEAWVAKWGAPDPCATRSTLRVADWQALAAGALRIV
jgi:hypothetical protein